MTKTPGLILVVTAKGTKSYYLYRRLGGRPTRILLGHHPLMNVERAREAAIKAYSQAIDGVDVNARKRAAREGDITLGEAWALYLGRLEARSSTRTIVTAKSRYETCLQKLASKRLQTIRRADVSALHAQLGKDRGHVTANRAIELLRSIFNHASKNLDLEIANPAQRIDLFTERSRERFLREDELPKFFAAIAAEPDELFRDFFMLAILTGARRGSLCAMKWRDVDLRSRTRTIPASDFKTKKVTAVVLPPQAAEILERRLSSGSSPFVFPSRGATGHLVEPKTAWKRIVQRSGLADLRIHDLRRTLASWQARGGASLPIIGKSLGHTNHEATMIYARLDLDEVRASVDKAAEAIVTAGQKQK